MHCLDSYRDSTFLCFVILWGRFWCCQPCCTTIFRFLLTDLQKAPLARRDARISSLPEPHVQHRVSSASLLLKRSPRAAKMCISLVFLSPPREAFTSKKGQRICRSLSFLYSVFIRLCSYRSSPGYGRWEYPCRPIPR